MAYLKAVLVVRVSIFNYELTNKKIHKSGFTIKAIQKGGGGGPPSTILPS